MDLEEKKRLRVITYNPIPAADDIPAAGLWAHVPNEHPIETLEGRLDDFFKLHRFERIKHYKPDDKDKHQRTIKRLLYHDGTWACGVKITDFGMIPGEGPQRELFPRDEPTHHVSTARVYFSLINNTITHASGSRRTRDRFLDEEETYGLAHKFYAQGANTRRRK